MAYSALEGRARRLGRPAVEGHATEVLAQDAIGHSGEEIGASHPRIALEFLRAEYLLDALDTAHGGVARLLGIFPVTVCVLCLDSAITYIRRYEVAAGGGHLV